MSDTPLPAPGNLPTIPVRDNEDLRSLMHDLQGALTAISVLVVDLQTALCKHELALLVEESKSDRALEAVDELRKRTRRVEIATGMAAE